MVTSITKNFGIWHLYAVSYQVDGYIMIKSRLTVHICEKTPRKKEKSNADGSYRTDAFPIPKPIRLKPWRYFNIPMLLVLLLLLLLQLRLRRRLQQYGTTNNEI